MKSLYTYLLVLLSVLFVSCTGSRIEKTMHIGVSQCCGGTWRDKMNDEMRRELLFHPEFDIEFANADDDIHKQEADIQHFIDKGVDLLVVSPTDSMSLTSIIAKAYDCGIPVIVADRRVVGDKFTAFVGGDNEAIGHEMADYAIEKLGRHGGRIIEIMGTAGSTPVTLRHKGLVEGLKEQDNITIIASLDAQWNGFDGLGVRRVLLPVLRENPDVDMIIAQNDGMALDAKVVADSLLPGNDIMFMGTDGLPLLDLGLNAIVDGKLDATAVYPTGGDVIIQTAVKILNGEPYDRDISIGTYLINNVKQAKMLNEMALAENHEVETIQMLKGKVDYYWELYSIQRTFLMTLVISLVLFCILIIVLLYLLKQRTVLSNKLKQASLAKLSFFTGVSHDFRTPLTLISGPISSLAADPTLTDSQKLLVQIAEKNTRVLLRLINQVLDFRKYESGKLELNLSDVDLRASEVEWFSAFNGLAKNRNITLTNHISDGDYRMSCDIQKLERVFFNVMGNAFKFTPEGGRIAVSLQHTGSDILLRIADSGTGIPDDMKSKVFDDFYQIKSASSSGSGIGLAVVKSFIELHGGTITVSNGDGGKGTVISMTIPFTCRQTSDDTMLKDYSSQSIETSSLAMLNAEVLSTKNAEIELATIDDRTIVNEDEESPIMLIIDDNTDIITFLKYQFESKYRIVTAQDGASGVQKALQFVPNIIICDLMMPVMDGIECCRRLRSELATCHIPIIMLTACSIDEQRIMSHEGGADAYVTKPFSLAVLQAQVDVLINNRKKVMETLGSKAVVKSTASGTSVAQNTAEAHKRRDEILSALDVEFLDKLHALIDKNIPNSNYSVEILAEDLGLSRSQLFRKVRALTNSTPLELIRVARLEKARELLETTHYNVSVVADMVGFNTPCYFAKCFKDYFGVLPNSV